jgi:pantoate kinase
MTEDARYIGSRGAGVCISQGVQTDLTVSESEEPEIKVEIDGKEDPALVTKSVVKQFLNLVNTPLTCTIKHVIEVPMSAGFGASGAGALSTALALNNELKLKMTRNTLATIAHIAEVENQTGLGDIIAQTFGGVEIRLEPGAPGIGRVDNIITNSSLKVICINLGQLKTKAILTDPSHRERINHAGKKLTEILVKKATVENFMRLSRRFMQESELATENLKDLLQYIEDIYDFPTSMVMLGESLFTFSERTKASEICDLIQAYSPNLNVFSSDIDFMGPRLIEA